MWDLPQHPARLDGGCRRTQVGRCDDGGEWEEDDGGLKKYPQIGDGDRSVPGLRCSRLAAGCPDLPMPVSPSSAGSDPVVVAAEYLSYWSVGLHIFYQQLARHV